MFLKFKDPGSAITHLIGCILAIIGAIPLIYKAQQTSQLHLISLTIFILSMILLYGASTLYHTFDINDKCNKRLKKMDHMMIFILIAGSYTPVCLIAIEPPLGIALLTIVWSIAVVGIVFKALWVTCPKWVSSVLYIGMGWICLFAFVPLYNNLSTSAFLWLLIGGIMYTIGGVIYALKLSIFNQNHQYFGSHEIFHIFVIIGSFCHYMLMYNHISVMVIA